MADTTSPTLSQLNLPTTVDAALADVPLTLRVSASDDASGVQSVVLHLSRPLLTTDGAVTSLTFGGYPNAFSSGYALLSETISKNADQGIYDILDAVVTDGAGNQRTYATADLKTLGVNTELDVLKTKPQLTALTAPTLTYIANNGGSLALSAQVSGINGDSPNIASIVVVFDRPIGVTTENRWTPLPHGFFGTSSVASAISAVDVKDQPSTVVYPTSFTPDPEDLFGYTVNGNSYSVFMPLTSTNSGVYHIQSVILKDAYGATNTYSTSQLAALGFPTQIEIEPDKVAPTLQALTIPGNIAGSHGSAFFAAAATDVGLGTQVISIKLDHALTMIDGTSSDTITLGTSSGLQLPGGAGAVLDMIDAARSRGSYSISSLTVTDVNNNSHTYTPGDLQSLSFATRFTVSGLTAQDHNGDGHSDIIWHHVSGALSIWDATGSGPGDTVRQDVFDATVDRTWAAIETFDWNGDGKADLLWRNQNGAVAIWNGTSLGFAQSSYVDTSNNAATAISATGDFNGDGKADILWRSADGAIRTTLSTGTGFQAASYTHADVGASWKIEGTGDFNGDGKADILWRNDNGALSTWNSTGTGFQEASTVHDPIDRSWHVVGIGDFNGDGQDDILWHNDNGALSVWTSTGSGFAESRFNAMAPANWNVAQVGDYNGDGMADLLWRSTSGELSIWHSTGSGWAQNTYYTNSVGTDWTIVAHAFPL